MFPKRQPYRNDKIRKSAQGEECTMRGPHCNGDQATTVLCHLNGHEFGKGIGRKADDSAAFYGCSSCHDWYDGRLKGDSAREFKEELAMRAVVRTHIRLIDKGILK